MTRRPPNDDAGETLVESLVSISIVGTVLIALIGAIMLSGSVTTILKAQSNSQVLGRSVYEAVSGYTIPKATPLVTGSTCNSAVTDQLTTIALDAAAKNDSLSLTRDAITYSLVTVSVDSKGVASVTNYPCSNVAGHPIASAGESATAIEAKISVLATGRVAVQGANGTVTRQQVTMPTVLKAYVYKGLT